MERVGDEIVMNDEEKIGVYKLMEEKGLCMFAAIQQYIINEMNREFGDK